MLDQDELRGKIRDDFMRRLFAVAISVGFAASVIQMDAFKQAKAPTLDEWRQIMTLIVGFVATIASWDGYLLSIHHKPLRGLFRFLIDVALVFTYMFLLITSSIDMLFIGTLSIIFILYVAWDILSIREYLHKYYLPEPEPSTTRASLPKVFSVYWGGLRSLEGIKRGPITTLSWGMFFWILWLLTRYLSSWQEVFVTASISILGLVLYRADKTTSNDIGVDGFKMTCRLLWIVGLLAVAAFLLRVEV